MQPVTTEVKIMRPAKILRTTMLLLALAAAADAQVAIGIPDFEAAGYVFLLDGNQDESAEIFQSRSSGSILVLSSSVQAPLLVRVRDAEVVTVDLMKVNRRPDGTVELLPNAALAPQGSFQVTPDRTGIQFSVGSQTGELREKPPLLGKQDIAGLEAHSPQYRTEAQEYRPSDPILNKLRQESRQIQVTVYFGSWCGYCQEMLPRIIRVAEALAGSKVRFDFYGLPPGVSSDPEAGRMGITGVPTGVVFVDGREVGRISGGSWKVPELAVNNLLIQNQSS